MNFKASHFDVESYLSASHVRFGFFGTGTIKVKLGFQDLISKCSRTTWALPSDGGDPPGGVRVCDAPLLDEASPRSSLDQRKLASVVMSS